MMRSLAVAFSLAAFTFLSACGGDPATDPDGVTTDGTGTATGALVLASWDATLGVPKCGAVGASCDTGTTLVRGRGTVGPESHAPNTINGTCADGNSGLFHSDESIDQLSVVSLNGNFGAGKSVRVDVKVWAYNPPSFDYLDVYRAPSATSPVWTLVGTVQPTVSGAQTLSLTYTLPTGTMQAVRAAFRYMGSAAPCTGGGDDDRDDIVFAVGTSDTTPPTITLTSPANGATVSGTITLAATATDNLSMNRVEFYVDGVLRGTDTTSPYSVSFDTTTVGNGAHNWYGKAFDSSGNSTTSAVRNFTVNNVSPPQLVSNGGFETTISPWVLTGDATWTNSGGAHGGTGLVALAGVDGVFTANVNQVVTIPSSSPANLTFWLNVTTDEYDSTPYDYFYVEVWDQWGGSQLGTLGTFSNMDQNPPGVYAQKSFSMAAWRGQTVELRFSATTDYSLSTTFNVDDVSLK